MINPKQDKIQQLKENYLVRLPGIVDDIKGHWLSVQADRDVDLNEMIRLVHSLVGTSGTYGFMDLSYRAKELEILLQTLQQDMNSVDQVNNQILDLIAAFHSLIEKELNCKYI